MTQTTNVMLEVLVAVVADGVNIPPGKYHGELANQTEPGFVGRPQQLPWEYRLSTELLGAWWLPNIWARELGWFESEYVSDATTAWIRFALKARDRCAESSSRDRMVEIRLKAKPK